MKKEKKTWNSDYLIKVWRGGKEKARYSLAGVFQSLTGSCIRPHVYFMWLWMREKISD